MRAANFTLIVAIALLAGIRSGAEPMDLGDATPREVQVRFEISPREAPGVLDASYSAPIPARLEPGAAPDRVRVTVRGADIERILLAEHGAKPGSFSDFVWVFDARDGDVVSAGISGKLVRRVDMGIVALDAEIDLDVALGTGEAAGFEPPRDVLGERIFVHCDDPTQPDCSLIPPRSLDPCTGYVNAVGTLDVGYGDLRFSFFAPMGEAKFEEVPGGVRVAASPVPESCPLRARNVRLGDIFSAWNRPATNSPESFPFASDPGAIPRRTAISAGSVSG